MTVSGAAKLGHGFRNTRKNPREVPASGFLFTFTEIRFHEQHDL
jgi:hypothetical protein